MFGFCNGKIILFTEINNSKRGYPTFWTAPVKVDSQLKSIDIMHFGWNIGKAFSKKRIHTATFIKNVFAHTLRDLEISTIERKMSHTESVCCIKLDVKKYNSDINLLQCNLLFLNKEEFEILPLHYWGQGTT